MKTILRKKKDVPEKEGASPKASKVTGVKKKEHRVEGIQGEPAAPSRRNAALKSAEKLFDFDRTDKDDEKDDTDEKTS